MRQGWRSGPRPPPRISRAPPAPLRGSSLFVIPPPPRLSTPAAPGPPPLAAAYPAAASAGEEPERPSRFCLLIGVRKMGCGWLQPTAAVLLCARGRRLVPVCAAQGRQAGGSSYKGRELARGGGRCGAAWCASAAALRLRWGRA